VSCEHFLVVEEKNRPSVDARRWMYSVDKIIVPRPSDVGRDMLVCGSVGVDLSEFVFGDSLTFSNRTTVT
jgi:hypothetical protein